MNKPKLYVFISFNCNVGKPDDTHPSKIKFDFHCDKVSFYQGDFIFNGIRADEKEKEGWRTVREVIEREPGSENTFQLEGEGDDTLAIIDQDDVIHIEIEQL